MIIKYSKERELTAEYLATQRMMYEYPREGYSYDNSVEHKERLKAGILGELSFLEFINNTLIEHCKNTSKKEQYKLLQQADFLYQLNIGKSDEFDFKKNGKTIDVKTYAKKVDPERVNNLNLMIDVEQTKTKVADYYVQVFLLTNGDIFIAGFSRGLPGDVDTTKPKPCHICPVSKLVAVTSIMDELIN